MEIETSQQKKANRIELLHTDEPATKPCVFCAETIQAAAVKCRFCGEFLNTEKAKYLLEAQSEDAEEEDGDILFEARPSMFGLASAFIKGAIAICIAILLINHPIEKVGFLGLSESQTATVGLYRILLATGMIFITAGLIAIKATYLKMMRYEVSAERIEYSRGIFDRRVDNLDMFRVIDLGLRKSLLDCLFGIGTVFLQTNDKSDPEFIFEKVKNSRELYDVIKTASLEADKRNGVIHLE